MIILFEKTFRPRYLSRVSQSVNSVIQWCPTLCNPMDCMTPGFPVHHQLPKLAQIHVHGVGYAIQPSHPLLSPSPPPFIFPSIRIFSNESVLWSGGPSSGASASSSFLPMNSQDWFPLGLICLISLQSKGLSRVFSNTTMKSINSSMFSFFLWSSSRIHTWLLAKKP